MEYSRFKKDLGDANWDQVSCIILYREDMCHVSPYSQQQENPMYVSPSTQYSNVTYRPKTKTDALLKENE